MQYLSRPFVVGDRIDVMTSSGGKVVSGFVEEVSPMRTHLRTDHWLSVMIPNKVACNFPPAHLCEIMHLNIVFQALPYVMVSQDYLQYVT